jgi:D-proline reductase (dithiol) PrdB
MPRWWNQLQSRFYSRLRWLPERAASRISRPKDIPMPPLASLGRPIAEARVGLVTAGGTHLASDVPFDMVNKEGDASFRVIPGDVDVADIRITHDYYDHTAADRDVNCVLPIERLREFVAAGEIGEVAPRHVGMMGHLLAAQAERLVGQTARDMAKVFLEDQVDLVLASPG